MSQKNLILPSQYVGKWTNDAGVALKVFQVLDVETGELIKIFMPKKEFEILGMKKILRESFPEVYAAEFEEDDEDRENLVSLTLAGRVEINLDK